MSVTPLIRTIGTLSDAGDQHVAQHHVEHRGAAEQRQHVSSGGRAAGFLSLISVDGREVSGRVAA